MTDASQGPGPDRALGATFMRLLVEDAIAARTRRSEDDTPLHRREEIRATFVAIEGITWIYREDTRDAAKTMAVLTPFADLALRERSFTVTDRGDIIERVQTITLPTVVRLTTKQAQLVAPSIAIDLGGQGWSQLKTAIEVRNRVTHPKSPADLSISADDLEAAHAGLLWLFGLVNDAKAQLLDALRSFNEDVRDLTAKLVAGDPQAIAAYRRVALEDGDD